MANRVSNLPQGQKVVITDENGNRRVEAPLPDGFGYSTGSEVGSPFAGYAAEGTLAQLLALQYGVSSKIGLVTKKLYQGPQDTEFTLDLEFNAYYSAFEEVLLPIITLQLLSVGREDTLEDVNLAFAENIRDSITTAVETGVETVNLTDDFQSGNISQLVRFMRSSPLCTIFVGEVFVVDDVYISSVVPSFSNTLDNQFVPMSATASLTIQLQDPMHQGGVSEEEGRRGIIGSYAYQGNPRSDDIGGL